MPSKRGERRLKKAAALTRPTRSQLAYANWDMKDRIAELEATIEKLKEDLRAALTRERDLRQPERK